MMHVILHYSGPLNKLLILIQQTTEYNLLLVPSELAIYFLLTSIPPFHLRKKEKTTIILLLDLSHITVPKSLFSTSKLMGNNLLTKLPLV